MGDGYGMLCENCIEYKKILAIEKYMLINASSTEFEREFNIYSDINSEYEQCENCESILTNSQLIIEDENYLLEQLFEGIAGLLSKNIETCEHCSEQNEIVQRVNHIFDEPNDIEIKNNCLSLIPAGNFVNDFIQEELESEFLEEEIDMIANSLVCQFCNHGLGQSYEDKVDYGYFSSYETIYTKRDNIELNRKFFGDKIKEPLSELAKIITVEELKNLNEDFKKSVHLMNSKFKDLFKLIKDIRDGGIEELEPVTISSGKYIYHARKHGILDPPISETELWLPPFGYSNNGRYNQAGISTFYACNSYTILSKELRKNESNEKLTIGLFKIDEDKILFPVNGLFNEYDYRNLISEIPEDNSNKAHIKKEYVLTNLIDLLVRNSGYDGIVYYSAQDDTYINYALFDKEKIQLISTFED